MTSAETPPQTIAGGRYLLVEIIGEGGMAIVYRGFDQRLQVWRAIKVLNPQYASSRKIKARFDTEAQTMALLEHPNIVRVYDVGSVGDISYIVMELVEGGTPVDWLERYGAMPVNRALEVIDQLCSGIAAAHAKGVIHRDIKPHNVLVTLDGTCRVTDFGIARVGDTDQSLTKTGAVMGTWGYMAPEQRSDAKNVDERGDVYAIAATLYTLVTNRIPMDLFAADRDKSVMSGVPEVLFDVLSKATEYNREDRYSTVLELQQALRDLEGTIPPDPPNTPPIAVRRPELRGPPPPEFIARAIPLVPQTGVAPAAPTLLPQTAGAGTAAGQATVGAGTPVMIPQRPGTDPDRTDADEAPRRRRGAVLWVLAAGPLLLGLLLFGAAGAVLFVPGLIGAEAGTDTGALELDEPPEPVQDAGLADAETDEPVVVEVEPEPDVVEPVTTTVRRPQTRPVVQVDEPQGTPEPVDDPDPDTEAAAPDPPDDTTPDEVPTPDPPDDEGTADDPPDVTVSETPIEQCVNVKPPAPPRVGTAAQFQANVCDQRPDVSVTLWYRPAGTSSWQSVRMPFRIGAYRAVVQVDERFSGGLEYYVETDGATYGGRSSPKRLSVN